MDSANFYKPLVRLAAVQNRLSVVLQASYMLVGRQTDCPIFYKPHRRLAVVRTDSPHFYNLLTYITVVKTGSPSLYKLPTC